MSENAIVVEGLRRRFGGVAALDGINLEVSVFALLTVCLYRRAV